MLLSAMIDNHIYWNINPVIDPRRVSWRRVVDMNDRALRSIVNSLGGIANGHSREDGFDITVASEVMAILCLSKNFEDLKKDLEKLLWVIQEIMNQYFVEILKQMARCLFY